MQVIVGLGDGMVRGKGDCHKHRQGCEEHVKFMEHAFRLAFQGCGVVLVEVHCTFIEG
jgi:hypothetical protein